MSGILLPGQEDKPQPTEGSGIEIAKGFSSQPTPPAQDAPSAEGQPVEPTPSEPPATAEAQQGGGQPDLAFPPAGAQVQCPSCGTPYTVPVFTILDFGKNPELRMPLLAGQINVARCPNCGVGGALSAPLMVHDPDNEFLGVFVPTQGGLEDVQGQKVIGELTQTLMRSLPTDAWRGYLLQAKQYMDWERFVEVLWGFEGVTPEMLQRQRDQATLLQRLASLATDPTALELALERDKTLIDGDFFAMLDRMILMSDGSEADDDENPLFILRDHLLDNTEAGAVVKEREQRIRSLLEQIGPSTTREDFLDIVFDAWQKEDGEQVVGALVMAATPLVDYQFLVALSERTEAAEDEESSERLLALRDFIVEVQDQQRQSRQAGAEQIQTILQEVLSATDVEAKLREYAPYLDENFLSILAANIQSAQQSGATAAVNRLTQVYHQTLAILRENMPPEQRFLSELLAAGDPGATRQLLKENREMVTPDFARIVNGLESEMRESGRADLADRLKALRGQIALML